MSSVKEHFFELQQQGCIEWVKQVYDLDIDEDDESWEELAAEYSAMLDSEEEEAEFQWLNRHTHSEFFLKFPEELANASSLLTLGSSEQHTDTLNKLVYAHAVTLMEALISSVVCKLVVSDKRLLINLVAGYRKLSTRTINLKDVAEQPKLVESIVLTTLKELTLHNVGTVKEVLGAMFGKHMDSLEVGEIGRICSKRHDIIHRNGKTVDDQPIKLTTEEVKQAIRTIREFAEELKSRIDNAACERESADF